MKKTILGLTALLLVSASFAQPTPGGFDKGPHQEMREHGRGAGLEKLNLTDAQKQQMKSINDDFRKQMQDLNAKENITVKQQRDQRDALEKSHRQKVESILTPAQKEQLAQLKADAEKRRTEMAEKHLADLKEKLNLSDAQVAAIKSNQQKTQSKFDSLMKNESISGSDKRQQLMTLREEMRSNVESVLTPEQKTKMQQIHNDRQDKMNQFHGHDDNDRSK